MIPWRLRFIQASIKRGILYRGKEKQSRNWISLHTNLLSKILRLSGELVLSMLHIAHQCLGHQKTATLGRWRGYRKHRWCGTAGKALGCNAFRMWAKTIDVAFIDTPSSLEHQVTRNASLCSHSFRICLLI